MDYQKNSFDPNVPITKTNRYSAYLTNFESHLRYCIATWGETVAIVRAIKSLADLHYPREVL